jgi:hypothetical protein
MPQVTGRRARSPANARGPACRPETAVKAARRTGRAGAAGRAGAERAGAERAGAERAGAERGGSA